MSVRYYRSLLAQRARIDAFRRAIARVVRPGDRVLDVGTGVGTFAFFAADAGAARVWGVDGRPVVYVARAVAALNGYGDRVELLRGWLPDVELPELADVVIFEDLPARLLNTRVYALLQHVYGRYAAPGARTVPAAAECFTAPVCSPDLWQRVVPPAGQGDYGIDWTPLREYAVNCPLNVSVAPHAVVAPAARLGRVTFGAAPAVAALGGQASWRLVRPSAVHGLAYWFDLDLGGGERLSNAPGADPGSWGHLFLPVDPPVEVGDTELRASVRVHALPDGAPGWLSWELAAAGAVARGHEFAAQPASLADLVGASPDGVPRLSSRGALEARVLALTDGRRSIREIGALVAKDQPGLSSTEAERLVARVLFDRIESGDTLAASRDRSDR